MTQTKVNSLVESCMNTVIGFIINFIANLILIPLFFNVAVDLMINLYMGILYTAISVARSYVVRRWFNSLIHSTPTKLLGDKA